MVIVLYNYKQIKSIDKNKLYSKVSLTDILPSERFKRRYLVLKISFKKEIEKDFEKVFNYRIESELKRILGVFDYSFAQAFFFKKIVFKEDKNFYTIVKVNNKFIERFKAALVLMGEINKKEVFCNVLFSSGSLKKSKIKFEEITGHKIEEFK